MNTDIVDRDRLSVKAEKRKIQKNGHPLKSEKRSVTKIRKSLEAAARTARYQALAQRVTYEEVIVTAHHQDDQCETLLLALKRGSGPAGLAAMPAAQPFAGSQLCRPLLTVSRSYLHTYAQQHQLTWIEDPSNQLLQFDRNFLRQQILPNLSVSWPQFTATVARSARLCGEQEQLLDELLLPRLVSLMDTQGSLAIGPLLTESVLKRQALLRRWCHRVGAPTPPLAVNSVMGSSSAQPTGCQSAINDQWVASSALSTTSLLDSPHGYIAGSMGLAGLATVDHLTRGVGQGWLASSRTG